MKFRLRRYIEYLFSRRVLGSVVVAFSLEHILQGVAEAIIPPELRLIAWTVFFLVVTMTFAFWGELEDNADDAVDSITEVVETASEELDEE